MKYLLLVYFIFSCLVITVVTAVKSKTYDKHTVKVVRQHLKNRNYANLRTPDVVTCVNGQKYIVNHIQYMCLSTQNDTGKILLPTGCATKNDLKTEYLIVGKTYHSNYFNYKCTNNNKTMKYQPLGCSIGPVEISPGNTVRSGKALYTCEENKKTGHMSLTVQRYLHDLCSLGHKNESLSSDDPTNCPGLTTSIYHSDYGSGTVVHYDKKKQQLRPLGIPTKLKEKDEKNSEAESA